MNDGTENDRRMLWTSVIVTTVAIAVVVAHLVWPHLKIDFVTVALLAVASIPWLRGIVSSVDLPGELPSSSLSGSAQWSETSRRRLMQSAR
jgi:hypothetical protein